MYMFLDLNYLRKNLKQMNEDAIKEDEENFDKLIYEDKVLGEIEDLDEENETLTISADSDIGYVSIEIKITEDLLEWFEDINKIIERQKTKNLDKILEDMDEILKSGKK